MVIARGARRGTAVPTAGGVLVLAGLALAGCSGVGAERIERTEPAAGATVVQHGPVTIAYPDGWAQGASDNYEGSWLSSDREGGEFSGSIAVRLDDADAAREAIEESSVNLRDRGHEVGAITSVSWDGVDGWFVRAELEPPPLGDEEPYSAIYLAFDVDGEVVEVNGSAPDDVAFEGVERVLGTLRVGADPAAIERLPERTPAG
jgi:hypothetical protein